MVCGSSDAMLSIWSQPMPLLASAPPVAGSGGGSATTGAQPLGPAPGSGTPPPSPFGGSFLFMMIALLAVMIIISTMTGRKEKRKRQELLNSIARHDRVQTIGGVIGTVTDLRDDEIVLRVDDATGTKITFAKSAVQGVLKKARESSRAEEPDAVEAA